MSFAFFAAALIQGSSFQAAAQEFTSCLKATVQMGMTTKMESSAFQAGFAKSCKDQEAIFRAEAIKALIAQGRTEVAAAAEVDGNIANGRRIYAADQASYVATGKVPR